MPQDLIGCWNPRKLKALIPRVTDSTQKLSQMIRRQWREGFCFLFFVVLRSSVRKICLDMCLGNSENSDGCPYLLRICFIYGTNVSVSRRWIPLQVVDREQGAFWFTNRVQVEILSVLKLVSFESFSPVAEVGKLLFRSTHGSEKFWYRTLVEQDLLIITL